MRLIAFLLFAVVATDALAHNYVKSVAFSDSLCTNYYSPDYAVTDSYDLSDLCTAEDYKVVCSSTGTTYDLYASCSSIIKTTYNSSTSCVSVGSAFYQFTCKNNFDAGSSLGKVKTYYSQTGCYEADIKRVVVTSTGTCISATCKKEGTVISKTVCNTVSSTASCFVATAAFGSPMNAEVHKLRQFRDNYLLKSTVGEWMVNAYYTVSPMLAEKIVQHEALKTIVRLALHPIVSLL